MSGKSDHDPTAFGCTYWTGDRAGVDLSATCPVCGPPDPREGKYDLIMPFVVVASRGGPYDDHAYVAGWELGAIDEQLRHSERGPWTIREDNVPQFELLVMKYVCLAEVIAVSEDGWVQVRAIDLAPTAPLTPGEEKP